MEEQIEELWQNHDKHMAITRSLAEANTMGEEILRRLREAEAEANETIRNHPDLKDAIRATEKLLFKLFWLNAGSELTIQLDELAQKNIRPRGEPPPWYIAGVS